MPHRAHRVHEVRQEEPRDRRALRASPRLPARRSSSPACWRSWASTPLVHFEEPNFSPYSCDAEYLEKYPVILIAGNRAQPFYHSEFRQIPAMRDLHPDPIVEVNNQMGQQMDPPLRDGDWAWIETHVGRVKMKVRLTTALAPGVVAAEHNWWFPEEDEKYPNLYGAFKSNINMILDDDPDKCGQEMGNYTCRNALCRIYRA